MQPSAFGGNHTVFQPGTQSVIRLDNTQAAFQDDNQQLVNPA